VLAAAAAPDVSMSSIPDPLRDFVLTLDVRSFQAGRRLPVALGSIYVTAWLPTELTGTACGGVGTACGDCKVCRPCETCCLMQWNCALVPLSLMFAWVFGAPAECIVVM
jgi:hypothetical protein